jgi:gluconolactonase
MLSKNFHHWNWVRTLAIGISASAVGLATMAQAADPVGDREFLPAGAKLEKLVDGKANDLIFAEGPVVTCDNRVLWSDITFSSAPKAPNGEVRAGNIMEYDIRTRKVSVFRSPSGMSNGLRIDLDCNLLAAEGADYGGQRLTRTDMKTGRATIVTATYNGRKYNALNDIAIDSKGRIYFSDPRYLGFEPVEQPGFAVYRVDADHSVHRMITDAGKTNGVAICPDEKHIFVVSNDNGGLDFQGLDKGQGFFKGPMHLAMYDLDSMGNATNRQILVDYFPEDGPDGLVCDADGDLWVAVRDAKRPGIYAYRVENGKAVEKAYIPTTIPTNVHFARGNSTYLYITADNSLYGIRTNKKGHHLQ